MVDTELTRLPAGARQRVIAIKRELIDMVNSLQESVVVLGMNHSQAAGLIRRIPGANFTGCYPLFADAVNMGAKCGDTVVEFDYKEVGTYVIVKAGATPTFKLGPTCTVFLESGYVDGYKW